MMKNRKLTYLILRFLLLMAAACTDETSTVAQPEDEKNTTLDIKQHSDSVLEARGLSSKSRTHYQMATG